MSAGLTTLSSVLYAISSRSAMMPSYPTVSLATTRQVRRALFFRSFLSSHWNPKFSAVARLTPALAAKLLAGATLPFEVAAVAPFAGAERGAVIKTTLAVDGVDFVARAEALVANARGAVVSPGTLVVLLTIYFCVDSRGGGEERTLSRHTSTSRHCSTGRNPCRCRWRCYDWGRKGRRRL